MAIYMRFHQTISLRYLCCWCVWLFSSYLFNSSWTYVMSSKPNCKKSSGKPIVVVICWFLAIQYPFFYFRNVWLVFLLGNYLSSVVCSLDRMGYQRFLQVLSLPISKWVGILSQGFETWTEYHKHRGKQLVCSSGSVLGKLSLANLPPRSSRSYSSQAC